MKQVVETLRSKRLIEDCSGFIPNLETAFAVQDQSLAELAPEHGGFAGYKIAFNSDVLMQKLGLPHPGMGRIFADQVFVSGVKLDSNNYTNFMIEPEIAARLKHDIDPGQTYSADTIDQYVERYFPAFELLDRRNAEGMMHPPTIIAHNVFNAGIVLGEQGLPPEELDYLTLNTNCTDNKIKVVAGCGIAPQSPAEALAFLANHFTRRGQVMPKGSLLLLGAHCPLYKVESGSHMELDLGLLGSVEFFI